MSHTLRIFFFPLVIKSLENPHVCLLMMETGRLLHEGFWSGESVCDVEFLNFIMLMGVPFTTVYSLLARRSSTDLLSCVVDHELETGQPAFSTTGGRYVHLAHDYPDDFLVFRRWWDPCHFLWGPAMLFLLVAVPEAWFKYLGFGKTLPQSLVPVGDRDDDWVLCSRVLPMGYLNSVAIAQHIHRNIVRRCMGDLRPPKGAEGELRRG